MVGQIPKSLKASLDWYKSSVELVRRVNSSLSDVTLRMPADGKRLELELWGSGVLIYQWDLIVDRDRRIASVTIRFELPDSNDATSLELHFHEKGNEKYIYKGIFSSNVVEIRIKSLDFNQEYEILMAMPTV